MPQNKLFIQKFEIKVNLVDLKTLIIFFQKMIVLSLAILMVGCEDSEEEKKNELISKNTSNIVWRNNVT